MKHLYLIPFCLLLCIYSCKTAGKAFERGNYDEAIALAVKKLQKNSNDGKAKDLLQKAYTYAVNQHEDQIRILSNSLNDNRWDQIAGHYMQLQNLYQLVNRYPAAANLVKATDYSGYIQTYSSKAADVHYEKGLQLMQENEKKAYRLAYQEFNAALNYKPGDYDIKKRMEEAYDMGLVKIVVLPISNYDGYYRNSSYQLSRFENNILRNLNNHSGSNFIRFVSDPEARRDNVLPDEVLELRFGNMVIGRPVDENHTRKVSKEVVVKETVYSKDSVVKQYAKVTAQITSTCRTLLSNADLYIVSRNAAGTILWQDAVRGQHHWQIEFATYTGDERALSDSDKALLNRPAQSAPAQEDIVNELLRQIDANLVSRVRNYYTHYQ